MSGSTSAALLATTITVAGSGSSNIETITLVKSSALFKNMNILVAPVGAVTASYDMDILMDDEIDQTYTYPTNVDCPITIVNYGDVIFPPNLGGNVIPAFATAHKIYEGLTIKVRLTNRKAQAQTFRVTVTFEEFDSCRMRPL